MIRVVLPAHLRTLARVGTMRCRVEVEWRADACGAVLDALEARIRCCAERFAIMATAKRRPFIRFFACERRSIARVAADASP